MSMQPEMVDVNAILYWMWEKIINLTAQLDELWANSPKQVEPKFNKKVEIIKLQIWIMANWDAFSDDFRIATAVLSRLKGPMVGRYTQVGLQQCYTGGVWPTWDDLKLEIGKYFKPQAECDWAC
ncbi:hypothetical protein SERLA73DRAFT_77660 [Serpula lacrymans var. lacrymans S7.3]|uniref:Retrotransposon gag domain-containing protein n=2 Tax=Serpula lacrymans var. lacrymans TaxID=341189 RepID=F8QA20_SERL3|nr:uncharacterized protein SERLADRAFT_442558 [Serpula lacrymans var. lacrymans S7.9]EGN94925.1 hypothetical protein SERLA73DRAFT_77660 [Serpula lacrymans var. lacrymans S7.3]EGO20424.1 hypothetical protein SERLADRAFT_442558 [Serpula lacrymans var. lacrymans S7.9]